MRMMKACSLKVRILSKERQSIATSSELLEYISLIGMVHLNKNRDSRSVCNVWDSKEHVWPVLMQLIESGQIFFCRALKSRTTYTSPEVASSLVALAGDRFSGLTHELEQAYETIQMEGPITRRHISELCGYPPKECRLIFSKLVNLFLITVFERGLHLNENWDEYAYWTVDEWLLNQDIESSRLRGTEKDEEIVLLAASKCLISDNAEELSKGLRWPIDRIYEVSKRLSLGTAL